MSIKNTAQFLGIIALAAVIGFSMMGCEQPIEPPTLTDITATYTGGSVAINTDVNSLKSNVTVTAKYSDNTSKTLNAADYSLSGDLSASGQKTVTVTYTEDGITKTDTFNVTVTAAPTADITYTVAQADGEDGVAETTGIVFTFSVSVTGLTADDITVTDGTGSVTKGTLSGSGTSWTLGVTVITAGNVTVAIAKNGIEAATKDVTVYKEGETVPSADITYTAVQTGGADNTANTIGIVFTFSASVTGLTADDITVTDGTGSVTKGTLSGSGASWTLGITVTTAGNVTIAIDKSGIEAATKDVTVYKAGQSAPTPTIVNITAIQGIDIPVAGETPVTVITETEQYTGTVTWSPNHAAFAGSTQYTATISLTAKEGYTLQGIAANFFTVEGATAANVVNSGIVTAVFPQTAAIPLNVTITDPINVLTPVLAGEYTERTTTFTVAISGFVSDTSAANVGLTIGSVTGLTFSGQTSTNGVFSDGAKTFTVTTTYNGTQQFASGSTNINISLTGIPTGYTYSDGTQTTSISIIDGQDSTRAIPITQTNIGAFNIYTTNSSTGSEGRSRHYKLMEDITLTGENNWTAISNVTYPFSGSFDGQGHIITGLTMNSVVNYLGMFSSVSGVVKNVGLVNCSITGSNYVGGVVGRNSGIVENCYVTGNITGSDYVGGIAGGNESGGTVDSCYATGNISGNNRIGGVVGINNYQTSRVQNQIPGIVRNSYSSGDVTGINYVGGVTGENAGSTVENCYATGNIEGNTYIGGVTGASTGDYGSVTELGATYSYNARSVVKNCYSTGSVIGNDYVGGIVGYAYRPNRSGSSSGNYITITGCMALNPSVTKTSSGNTNIGRVVSNTQNYTSLSNNFAWNGMTVQYNTNTTLNPSSSATGIHGANKTFAELKEKSAWETAGFFDANTPWRWTLDEMPHLFDDDAQDWPSWLVN